LRTEALRPDGSDATAVLPGFDDVTIVDDIVFYSQSGQLRASRIDLRSLEPAGEAVSLAGVHTKRLGRSIAAPDTSTLTLQPVYRASDGTVTPLPVAPDRAYRWPRLSPDGRRLAIGTGSGLRVVDLERRSSWPMEGSTEPVWTPDGGQVIMSAGQRPRAGLVRQVADGSRPAESLLKIEGGDAWPTSVSRDGAWLAYYGATDGSGDGAESSDPGDLFFMDLKTRKSRRLALPAEQKGARFSPDERWIAYQSDEDGRWEVHLRDWPALASRYVVSTDGGEEPSWSADGRTLYYRRRGDMMTVTITESTGAVAASEPRVVFTGALRLDSSGDQSYDIAPDGRFLLMKSRGGERVVIDMVLNWIAEVRAQLDGIKK
jgi:hypothetical protein